MRAFDVRTGKLLWTFNTIPRPGEFGNDTWENDSWAVNGNTGVWTQITVDEELGLVYLPVEDSDLGLLRRSSARQQSLCRQPRLRRSEDRQAQVAFPGGAPPDLGLRPVVGADPGRHQRRTARPIKAVALPSKEAFLYVFDRVTGQPVWPIEERPVPQSDVPGEKTSPTQPFPTKPPAYARQFVNVPDDLIDFTPELRAQAKDNVARYKTGPMFLPPIVGDGNGLIGALTLGNAGGGTNWPGAGYDPETHIVYAQAQSVGAIPYLDAHAARRIFGYSLRHGTERYSIPRLGRSRIRQCGRRSAAASRLHQPKRRRQTRGSGSARRQPSPCKDSPS